MDSCKKTPLYETHVALGGKLIDFGGWALPVQYTSILEEHKAVRERAGLFDVSHMGELFVSGEGAFDFLQNLLTNDFSGLEPNRCRYSAMCYPDGGAIDDVIVYKFSHESYLVVVNAANTEKDFAWMRAQAAGFSVSIRNESAQWAQIALQGPRAEDILSPLAQGELPQKNYTFAPRLAVAGVPCLVSRTGYTGEDGFELYCGEKDASKLYAALLKAGEAYALLPCGLGARDTLRFESSMPLYGHELTKEITPLEAGLKFAVKLDKPAFIGKEALLAPQRRMRVGLRITGKGVAREHCPVYADGAEAGVTTSGGPTPTLGGNCAMALIDVRAKDAAQWSVLVRGRAIEAERVKTPFYKRP